ncbi:MAG: cytochrome c-type biogenesis protein CcmH [Bdellovibrionales bacterium]|nr:cytochrome c-type biogenesis protein CcmH [Bdellovibrionales bacterium]
MNKFIFVALTTLLLAVSVSAQNLTVQQQQVADQVIDYVLSPYCPGRLLRDCSSSGASELRDQIRQHASQGMSKQEILEELYTIFGDDIRGAPEYAGFGWVAWLTPLLFLLGGLLLVVVWLGKQKSTVQSTDSTGQEIDPEMLERIEDELERD